MPGMKKRMRSSPWAKMFERFWAHQLLRIKEQAERKHKGNTN